MREAKSRGLPVTAEVTPHHLLLTDEAVLGYQTFCKVNPPLRSEEDVEAVLEALRDGTIDCIATDHAPHSTLEKDCDFDSAAYGINGLEPALAVLLELVRDGHLSEMRLVEALTSAPAKIGKLEGGALREGAPADVAVIDPEKTWTIRAEALRSKSHNTPWIDREVTGAVTHTFVEGDLVYEREEQQ